MRRVQSCKYISTTPTVSVMETKMGENLRKEREREAEARILADGTLELRLVDHAAAPSEDRCMMEEAQGGLADDLPDDFDDGLIFGLDD